MPDNPTCLVSGYHGYGTFSAPVSGLSTGSLGWGAVGRKGQGWPGAAQKPRLRGSGGGGYLIGSGGPRIFFKNINGNFEFFNITNEIKVFFDKKMFEMAKTCINFKGKASSVYNTLVKICWGQWGGEFASLA